jgi:hypothetical protein
VLAAALIYAVLSLVMVGQGLLPGRTLSSSDGLWTMTPFASSTPTGVRPLGSNFEMADTVAVFQPFYEYTRAAMPDVPLWNPHIMAGRPYLADAQSAIFSPFSVPAYVLPFWKSLAVIAVLRLFFAAFGMFLFARALGMRFASALLSGSVFAFGTFFVVWLGWPLTNVFPLIPWLLLLTEAVIRRPGTLSVAGLSALVGLQFLGGHPETSFHVMVVTTLWFAFRVLLAWWRGGRDRSLLVRPTVAFGLSLGLGAALAALTLLPLLELFRHSDDYQHRLDNPPSFTSSQHLGAFFLSDYWGRPTQTETAAFVSNRGYYAGGITLMLAAVGLLLRPTVTRVAVAVFGAVTLTIVIGFGPIAHVVFHLPGFRTAHNGRMLIFVLISLALLAGWGLDELSRRQLPPLRGRALAAAAATAIFCVPFVWMLVAGTIDLAYWRSAVKVAWLLRDLPSASSALEAGRIAPTIRLGALLEWLLLAGAGLVLIIARLAVIRPSWRLPAGVFAGLAVAVLVLDLFRANMGFNPAIPLDHARQPTTGAIRYLQSRTPNRFAGVDVPGAIQPLGPDLAMRYGLYDARGYDYPVERRYDRLWRATVGPQGDAIPPTTLAQPTVSALHTLSLLSVSDLLQKPSGEPLRLPGLRLAYSGRDARVYRNPSALPRAFLVDRQRTVAGDEAALSAVSHPTVDTRRVAITERPLTGIPQENDAPSAASAGSAGLVTYESKRVVARARANRRAVLVVTDVHYPGWKAWVDGRPAPLERVDYLLRGVVLPAGTHRVELRYEPTSWRVGWMMSILALAVVVALTLIGWRRDRRRAVAAG